MTSVIALIRELRLRKWACWGFLLISFIGLISFYWVPDLSLSIPFLYMFYIGITLYVLKFAKTDIFSPLFFFILFSFLGFGLSLPLLSLFPDSIFFANPFYHPNFEYNNDAIALAFAVFLIGYVSFISGFNVVKKGVNLRTSKRTTSLGFIAVLAAVLMIATFIFRSTYHVGVPGYYTASFQHAGYIYYPLIYGSAIALCLTFYTAVDNNSTFYTIIALLLFGLSALLQSVLGWKGGFAGAIMFVLLIYYYVSRYRRQNISKNIRRSIASMFLILVILFVLLYSVITYYRAAILIGGGQATITNLVSMLGRGSDGIGFNFYKTLSKIQGRVSGLNNLVAIVAYFQQGIGGNVEVPSFFLNLFNIGIYPEQFYTWFVLGVDPAIVTTNAPTGWGVFYIYGGIIGVITGMFLLGVLSKVLYCMLLLNIKRDGRWIVFYTMFMVNIFLPVVFAGTIVNYVRKNFIALLVMYVSFILVLNLIPTGNWLRQGYLVRQRKAI